MNRSAFEVMYPGKVSASISEEEKKKLPTEAELERLRVDFFKLASVSKSVVFARAQPAMKKKMVTEIQARVPSALTLAIGDGANDTDMIQAAHIGVGIAGVEGTAATNSADYAIGTFSMLHTLLFVHGFWSYQRIATLVNFIFYKASLVALTSFNFGFLSGFSGQQFFNDPPYQLYNVVFTALPVIIIAIFDKQLPRAVLQNNPIAYQEAKSKAFSPLIFSTWILRALVHGLIIFWIPYGIIGVQDVADSNGTVHGHWTFSTTVFLCVVIVPTLLVIFEMTTITLLHVVSVLASLGSLFLFTFLLSTLLSFDPDLYGVVAYILRRPVFLLTILLTVCVPLLLELACRAVLRDLRPSVTHILQERVHRKRLEHLQPMRSRLDVGIFSCLFSLSLLTCTDVQIPAPSMHDSKGDPVRVGAALMVVAGHEDETKWALSRQPRPSISLVSTCFCLSV